MNKKLMYFIAQGMFRKLVVMQEVFIGWKLFLD